MRVSLSGMRGQDLTGVVFQAQDCSLGPEGKAFVGCDCRFGLILELLPLGLLRDNPL
jgi:hypothetical protein